MSNKPWVQFSVYYYLQLFVFNNLLCAYVMMTHSNFMLWYNNGTLTQLKIASLNFLSLCRLLFRYQHINEYWSFDTNERSTLNLVAFKNLPRLWIGRSLTVLHLANDHTMRNKVLTKNQAKQLTCCRINGRGTIWQHLGGMGRLVNFRNLTGI